jgi:hypothetical protein
MNHPQLDLLSRELDFDSMGGASSGLLCLATLVASGLLWPASWIVASIRMAMATQWRDDRGL